MRGSCLALIACLLVGCGGSDAGDKPDPQAESPRLGGVPPTATPPATPMDEVEKPIARRLGAQVATQGLRVDHLACPQWDGTVPAELACRGWFDGVEGSVLVSLRRDEGGTVGFDAVLQSGVIATERLVDELTAKGYTDVDCGQVPAYPTDVGSTITCAVTRKGVAKHVVATITDRRGGVTIRDF